MDISAKHLRMGFRLGIYDFDDVQSWVDFNILKNNEPSEKVIELSFLKSKDNHEIYSLLSSMPNTEEDDESLIKVLGDIEDKYLNDLDFCRNLAKSLYAYCVDKDYNVNERLNEILFFDDGFDLAIQGIGDSVETLHSSFKEFIYEFKSC